MEMLPMTDYEECRRYARAFANVTRNLTLLQDEFRAEFGLTVEELERRAKDRRRMTTHTFPPPQPGAETRVRGKLRSYREKRTTLE